MQETSTPTKKILSVFAAILITSITIAQVNVTATGGVASASYAQLRLAFNAINAGTHTGTITIGISANTTETAASVLNSSGAGAASYTSVMINPTVDGVMISGPMTTGHGIIELNGADNVTIDGDNPNTAGTNRNLTLKNTSAITIGYTSCVRLATSTLVTNCDNVTVKNLNLTGSGVGRNTAAYTSEVVSWGVIASASASTVSMTTAPTALNSATILVPAGQTDMNLLISNNNIQTVSRGISINGSATSVAPGLVISNNVIGNSSIGSVDQVTGVGITAQGSANGVISGNTVRVEGYIYAGSCNRGISIGLISISGVSGMLVEKNTVEKVYNNNVKTRAAIGIEIVGGTNHIIQNNFVGQCMNSQVAGTATTLSPTTGAIGIRINAGTGHVVYHNTVHLTGAISGSTGKNIVAAFAINVKTATGIDVRNNIFSNQTSGGNTTLYNTLLVSMYLPSGGTSTMNLTLNNNTYYQNTGSNCGIAQAGNTGGAAFLYTAGNFNPAAITPATNLRSYTKALSAAGTNDNACYASSNGAPVIAPTNLHISFASAELPNVDQKGDPSVGLATDIDGDVRPSASTTNPDIGADEFVVPPCFAANGGTISPSTVSSCAGQTVTLTSVGATNATGITYQWMVAFASGGPYSNVVGGVGSNTVAYTTPALVSGTYYFIMQTTCSSGPLTGLSNQVTVTVNAKPTVSVSGSSSFCAGGNATLTGSGTGTSQQWYVNDSLIVGATSSTFLVTSAGSYNMIMTNAAGCSDSATTGMTVLVNPLPAVTASAAPSAVCPGAMTTLSGGGATSYAWTGGVTDNVAFAPASSGTYTVTGTDGNGCTATATQAVTVNTLPSVSAMAMPAAICSGNNTTLMGMGAVSYAWTGGVTDNVAFVPASSSTYTVTGTAANGCTATATQSVTVNTLPSVSAMAMPAAICSGNNTTLMGMGAVSYAWTGGVTDNVAFAPASSGTYTVTGTAANGCTATATQAVTVNTPPSVTAMAMPAAVCSGNNTTLMGMGATSYAWTGGVTDNVAFVPASSSTYTVTGTDGNGCTATATQSVTVNTPPSVTAMAMPATVCSGSNTTLMGMGATSYAWTGGVTDNVAFVPASSSTYTVTGTDGNGCTATATQSVTVNTLPSVSAMAMPTTVCAGDNTTLMGMGATSYSWTGGVTDNVAFVPASSSTYTVTGTDGNGCTATATQSVTVNTLPTVTFAPFTSSYCNNGSAFTLTNGSPSGGSYSGTGAAGSMYDPTAAGAGMYLLTYTYSDVNSCMSSDTATITVDVCSGIADNEVTDEFSVYPNPTNGTFSILVNNPGISEIVISVSDLQGKLVYSSLESGIAKGTRKEIQLDDVSKGMYMVKITSQKDVKIYKLIVR